MSEVEVLPPEANQELVTIVKREGVSEQSQAELLNSFRPYHTEITRALSASKNIQNGEDPTQRKIARTCRLELRRVRCAVEDTRKNAKANALRYGKAVDGLANVLKFLCEPEEERLDAIEQHESRKEEARIAALIAERTAALVTVEGNPLAYNLGTMDSATWDMVFSAAKKAKQDREEADRKAEADRIAREQADRIAREKAEIEAKEARAEAERLKKDAEAREAKFRQEREAIEAKARKDKTAADAKLAKEREEREAAERKAKAEADAILAKEREARIAAERKEAERVAAEKKAIADQQKAEKKAAAAPDKTKLLKLSEIILEIELPDMSTKDGEKIINGVIEMQRKMSAWIVEKANEI